MKTHFVFLVIALLMISSLKAQVKIGDNPQNIDPASVLELESNNRVLVITRVSDAQMSTINPLPGALVYNTDAECIHYFNGTEWINICEALDNSFTTSTQAVFNTASRDSTVVVTQTDTPDGINYNFEVNRITGENIRNFSIFRNNLTLGIIGQEQLQDGAVALSKIEAGTMNGQLIQWQGGQWTLIPETDITVTEIDGIVGNEILDAADGTLVRSGAGDAGDPFVLGVAPLGITNNELGPDAVTSDKILDGTIATADLDDNIITFEKMATNSVGNLEIRDNSVNLAKISTDGLPDANSILTTDNLGDPQWEDKSIFTPSSLSNGDILIGNAVNIATGVTMSGDATIDNAGVIDLTANAVESDEIAAGAVNAATINNDVAGSGLVQNVSGALDVNVDNITIEVNPANEVQVRDGGITSAKILDGTISTNDIDDLAVTNAKLENGAITTGKIRTSAVNTVAIANNTIIDEDVSIIAAIQGTKISPNFGPQNVVTTGNVIVGANTITNLDGTAGQVLTTDGLGNATWEDTSPLAVQTTATIDGTGLAGDPLDLADDAVTTAKILDANVTNAKIADDAVDVNKIGTLGAADADRVLTTDGLGDPQWEPRVNFASSALTNGNIFVGDATNNAAGVAMSGDATITNTGVLTIEADAVNSAKIEDGQVQTNDIADENVTPLKIQPGADGQVLTTVGTATVWQAPAVVAMGKVDASLTPANTKINGASVTNPSTGNYTVTFDTARPDANYTIQLTLLGAPSGSTIQVAAQTNTEFTVSITTASANFSVASPPFTTDSGGSTPHTHTGFVDPFPIVDNINFNAINANWYFTITDF